MREDLENGYSESLYERIEFEEAMKVKRSG